MNLKRYENKLNKLLDNIKWDHMTDDQYNEWRDLWYELFYLEEQFDMTEAQYNKYRLLLLALKAVEYKYHN